MDVSMRSSKGKQKISSNNSPEARSLQVVIIDDTLYVMKALAEISPLSLDHLISQPMHAHTIDVHSYRP